MIQLNENNGNGNASVVFFPTFHLVWRCFFQQRFAQKCNVGVSLQFSSIFNVLFEQKSFTVYFVCWLCSCSYDFVSFVKIFNMQLQGVLGIFQQRFVRNAMSVFLCSFHQLSMFCLCSNLSPCNFCLLVVQLLLRFCFFRKNFQYAVARCVGYFSTTFCAEMQCRCLCRFHQLSMFCLCSNLSPCILSVGCAVAPAILFFAEVLCFCM